MAHMNSGNGTKVLARSRKGRMVAGVCEGVADYFGIDVTVVRAIVAVVSVITSGAGVLAYLAAWVIIPGEGERPRSPRTSSARSRTPDQAGGRGTGFRPFRAEPPSPCKGRRGQRRTRGQPISAPVLRPMG